MLALFAFTALGNPDDDAPDAAAALWQRARVAGADSPDMAVDTPALPFDSLMPAVIATDTVDDKQRVPIMAVQEVMDYLADGTKNHCVNL